MGLQVLGKKKEENQIKTLQTHIKFNQFYLYTWKSNSTLICQNSQLENIKKEKDPNEEEQQRNKVPKNKLNEKYTGCVI